MWGSDPSCRCYFARLFTKDSVWLNRDYLSLSVNGGSVAQGDINNALPAMTGMARGSPGPSFVLYW